MTPGERAEAERTAIALLGAVIDNDTCAAGILLEHASRQVLAQACTHLATFIVVVVEESSGDVAGFRADVTEALRR